MLNLQIPVQPVPRFSSPVTEEWFFVALLLLFGILAYAAWFSFGWLKDAAWNFFKNRKRKSLFASTNINAVKSKMIIVFFALMVFALYLYAAMYDRYGGFTFFGFIKCSLTVSAFYGLKRLLMEAVAWVFVEKNHIEVARESYTSLTACFGIALFPLLAAYAYIVPEFSIYVSIVSIIVSISVFLIYAVKLFQIFLPKKLAFFYIILYLCALEIMPLFLLYRALLFVI